MTTGLGATPNVSLPPGSGRAADLAALDRVVVPALGRHEAVEAAALLVAGVPA
jgi:hypothetical protein